MSKFGKIKNSIKENWLEYLLYLFVFVLPWQTRWIFRDYFIQGEVFEYGRLSLYGFDIILIILLVGYYFRLLKAERIAYQPNKRGIFRNKFFSLAFGLTVYSLASVFWADEKVVSLYWGLRMLLGLGVFYLLQKINFSKLRLAIVAVTAGAIQGLLAIWQFLGQEIWGGKWLGMAPQSARELGASVVEFGLERWLRAYGSLAHPNILGALLVLSFIGVVYLTTKIQHKYHKLFLIFSSSFIILGIFFSFSRSAWIVFGLVYILGGLMIFKRGSDFVKKFARGLGIYSLILLTVFIVAAWPIVKTRLNIGPPARLELKSNTERVESYYQAEGIIKDNWLIGLGMGNYAFEVQKRHIDLAVWKIGAVHNVYVLALAELGALGILLLGLLAGYIFYSMIKNRKWAAMGLVLVVGSLFIFDHFWWTSAMGMYLAWLVWGISLKEV